jgi:hypothetical protein
MTETLVWIIVLVSLLIVVIGVPLAYVQWQALNDGEDDHLVVVAYNSGDSDWPELYGPFADSDRADAWVVACQREGWPGSFCLDRLIPPVGPEPAWGDPGLSPQAVRG